MGVDQTSLDRIRNATFPVARRGYEKHEVEKFLTRLADWLETGGGDESRSETVKRELERVGERTGAILSQAEESAQQIRSEAEQLAQEAVEEGQVQSEETRREADAYDKQTRAEADAYSAEVRAATDKEVAELRAEADQDARDTIADAQAQARRIVEEGSRRREDIESVIADLVRRRDEVLDDAEELSGKLTGAVGEHRPLQGSDPFDAPDELDPLQREMDRLDDDDLFEPEDQALEPELEAEDADEPEASEPEPDEPEPEEEPVDEQPAEDLTEEKPAKKPAKPKRRRSRKVRS